MGMLKPDTAGMCRDISDSSETITPGARAVQLQLPQCHNAILFNDGAIQFIFRVRRVQMASDTS